MNVMAGKLKVTEDTSIVWAKMFTADKTVPLWLQGVATAWFFVTYITVTGVTPMRYLLVATILGLLVLNSRIVLPNLVKAWPLYVLPIFSLSSFAWSPHPAEAIRTGVFMILTPTLAIVLLSLMDTQRALRCLMFAGWMASLIVLPHYQELSYAGPYGSKNYTAMQMNFMMLLSLTTALNKNELPWIRMTAIPFIAIGAVCVYYADSTTQLVLGLLGSMGIVALRVVWVDVGRGGTTRSLIFLSAIMVILMAATLVLSMPGEDFMGDFLEKVGKDSTFSGRKLIWAAGRVIQEQHPILGTGLAGFWQMENGAAQSINYYDFKPFGTALTFHNAYMEVRVHLGLIGLTMFIGTWIWQGQRAFRNWLGSPGLEASALLVTLALVFISSFTESISWSVFSTPVNIMIFASTAAFVSTGRQFVGYVPLKVTETRA